MSLDSSKESKNMSEHNDDAEKGNVPKLSFVEHDNIQVSCISLLKIFFFLKYNFVLL